MLNILNEIYRALEAQLVNIPTDTVLAKVYLILNAAVTLILSLMGYTSDTNGGLTGGGLF